jgi:uroporphyrinogen III methyltransferase/synthase
MATLSLDGLRVLVTRPGCHPADKWGRALAAAGATVLAYPTIQTVPPPSWQPLDQALDQAALYDWMVFSSATAVRFLQSRLPGGRLPVEGIKIAAVGSETARLLREGGLHVDLVPAEQRQVGLVTAFSTLSPGTRILMPRALEGQDVLVDALRARGCLVDVVPVYQTVPIAPLPALPVFDVALFASPSALRAFFQQHGKGGLALKTVAVIGPTTAEEAAGYGLSPTIAAQPNIDALISAIVRARSSHGGP